MDRFMDGINNTGVESKRMTKIIHCVKRVLSTIVIPFPNFIKVFVYRKFFKYKIGKNVRIGLSWIFVDILEIADHVIIGHLNSIKGIPLVKIGSFSIIGRGNTFTSTHEFTNPKSLEERSNRPELIIGSHCAVVAFHYLDIQDQFEIGDFTTISGKNSVFFSHYLNVISGAQSTKPIYIGKYCMIGSSVQFVPGARIPDYCVVGMGSVVTKKFLNSYWVIGGNPASEIKRLPENAGYFTRKTGYVSTYTPSPFKNNY